MRVHIIAPRREEAQSEAQSEEKPEVSPRHPADRPATAEAQVCLTASPSWSLLPCGMLGVARTKSLEG